MRDAALWARLATAKVLVAGDVMLDRYLTGETHRISPEAPVPIVKVVSTEDKAGGAANVARNIAHLTAQASLLGIIGDDGDGQKLTQLIQTDGITSHLMCEPAAATITKMRILSRQQQMARLDYEIPLPAGSDERFRIRFGELCKGYSQVIFSDYSKGALTQITSMIQSAHIHGLQVLVDPKNPNYECYRGADILTPNLSEFKQAGGRTENEAVLVDSAREMLARFEIGALVLTRSEAGLSVITAHDHWHFPACVHEVSDVTGAGDTVIAVLAVMLGAGLILPKAAEMANLAAGIVVGKLGAATVTPAELTARLRLNKNNQKMHDWEATDHSPAAELAKLAVAQRNGERIVFTNGCFDILHAGHVHYLNQARALGDRLMVGLNSDASVSRLKGAGRPINCQADRAAVLKGLRAVDWVIPFGDLPTEQDTPLELIRQVRPDVLVKGGDYTIDGVVGAAEVQSWGGEVRILDFVADCSTTQTISRVRNE